MLRRAEMRADVARLERRLACELLHSVYRASLYSPARRVISNDDAYTTTHGAPPDRFSSNLHAKGLVNSLLC